MTTLPYIQLYISDYLADTAHLTTAQHGAYLLLIFNYWQKGHALNNNGERLANVTRMNSEEWADAQRVLREFFRIDGDLWFHERIESDLEKVRDQISKNSKSGKIGAEKRWGKMAAVKPTNGERYPLAIRSNGERLANKEEEEEEEEDIKTTTSCASDDTQHAENAFYLSAKKKKLKGEVLEGFNRFWEAFDYPKDKARAADSWLKVFKLADLELIIAGACQASAERPGQIAKKRTPPYPEGWLTGRRWEDYQESSAPVKKMVLPDLEKLKREKMEALNAQSSAAR